jgi:alkaline phosphatase
LHRLACVRGLLVLVALAACGSDQRVSLQAGAAVDDDAATASGKRIVILMIGDGMGRGQQEAASHFAHGAPGKLFLESLPVRGTVITSGPSGTTDSAASATTLATGVRAFNGAIGIDRDGNPVKTVVELAHELGLPAGIVVTSSLPHATPGAFTAHRDSRHALTKIADDQVRVVKADVMLGGGAQYFLPAGADSLRDDDGLLDELAAAGYAVVRTAGELAAAPPTGRLAGIFAPDHLTYSIARSSSTTEPTLREMTRVALERLDASPDGFFLMIEGSRIDMAGHGNQLAEAVGETIAFDDTVKSVAEWASGRDDVTLIVTSDHECGGLEVIGGNGAGVLPSVRWRWLQHTNAPVGVYAQGPGTAALDGSVVDHRAIHRVIESRLRGVPYEPPLPELLPDGRLADLPHVAATQTNPSGFGAGYNQLDALHLAADERGLAIGIAGVFESGHNAVVVLLDVDFGASTGPAKLRGALDDTTGAADALLSALNLDAPLTAGFGVDLALVSIGAQDPMLEHVLADAGMRGLRAPYGSATNLGWYGVATNFGDDITARPSPAPPVAPIAGRGWEVHVPWRHLYPSGRPAGARLAIAAVLVNDDGGYTSNQALPPFSPGTANPGRTPTRLPGIVVFTVDGDGDGIVDPITSSTVMP